MALTICEVHGPAHNKIAEKVRVNGVRDLVTNVVIGNVHLKREIANRNRQGVQRARMHVDLVTTAQILAYHR